MKISAVVAAFALGAIATFAISKDRDEKSPINKSAFDKEVTIKDIDQPSDHDIMDQQRRAMDRMRKMFNSMKMPDMDMAFNDSMVSSITGMKGGNVEISTKNDDKFEYIEVVGDDLDPKALNVEIKDGMVSISGTIEKRVDNDRNGVKSTSSYVSSFQRSFNIPTGVDENKVSFEPKKNKLVIKFQKV